MMTQIQKRRLGRGLAALIGDDADKDQLSEATPGFRYVPIEHLRANPRNPRKNFAAEELEDLASSIRAKGLLQPLIVRPRDDGEFEIVAGERRWRASQLAELHQLPVVVRALSDGEMMEIALIENIQRENLNPLEEAQAYAELIDQHSYTQQQLADALGKSRSHIANMMRLMALPADVRGFISEGRLTAGHARTLITTDDPEALAQQIMALGLSVRDAEELARKKSTSRATTSEALEKNPDIKAFEKQLSEATGLKIAIKAGLKESGKLIIDYQNLDQLEDVSRRLAGPR